VGRDSVCGMHASSLPQPRPLPELHGQEAFDACTKQRKPCVLRGAGRDWPAVARWTLASLAQRLGRQLVPAVPLRGRELGVDARRGVARTMREAAEVLREIEQEQGTSYLIAPLDTLPADIRDEAPIPMPCRGAAWVATNVWIAPAGTITPLHFDIPHNFLVQIRGAKRVMVFERGHFMKMYKEPLWSSVPNFSRVDPMNPALDRFPAFRDMQPFVTDLAEGDVLFLPSATWHHVTSETNSISVNYWWAEGLVALFARGGSAFKQFRGIR
jgi:hypothetical protein